MTMRSDLHRFGAHALFVAALAVAMSAHAGARGVEADVDSAIVKAAELTGELHGQSAIPAVAWKTADQMPVWKTIVLGTGGNLNMLRDALESASCTPAGTVAGKGVAVHAAALRERAAPNCRLGESAAEIMGRPGFHLSRYRQEFDLVVMSAVDLGFGADEDVTLEAVYDRAEMLGFALCPPEIGPLLRVQYLDQPAGEFLQVAMQPIATYSGALTSFTLGNDTAGLLLIGGDGRPQMSMPAINRFVFVKPRPQPDR